VHGEDFRCSEVSTTTQGQESSPHIYRAAVTREYRAAVTRESAGKRLVKDLVDKVYDGAAMSLVLHSLTRTKASPEELAEVRRLLNEMVEKS
jgi:predicted transcriptional regulator